MRNEAPRPPPRSIRQSCSFCRSKKIRCSGDLICSACRSRNLNCIYTSRAPKGRNITRANVSDNPVAPAPRVSLPLTPAQGPVSMPVLPAPADTTAPLLDPVVVNPSIVPTCTDSATQRDLLESNFQKQYCHSGPPVPGSDLQPPAEKISYKELFFSLTPALLDLLSAKIGRLRSGDECDSAIPHYHHLRNYLAQDGSQTMFGDDYPVGNVSLPGVSDQTVCQMMEVWFSQHPLSLLLSKTAFLHDFRSGLADPGLLAIILAGVTPSMQPSQWAPGETVRQFAREQARQRRADQTSLPTIQLLVLLGWHLLCTGERMNGADYASVALELGCCIFWLAFSIKLWIALPLDAPFEYPAGLDPGKDLPSPDISTFLVNGEERSVSSLCQTVRSILSEELERPHARMGDHPSEIITRVAYQLLNIHLLFPQEPQQQPQQQQHSTETTTTMHEPTDTLIQNTTHAILSFIHSLRLVEQSLEPPDILNGISPCPSSGVILAGLDASGRALQEILRSIDHSPKARSVIMHHQPYLAELVTQLYTLSKHPRLRAQAPTTLDVKHHLKKTKQQLERLSGADNVRATMEALFVPQQAAAAAFDPLSPESMALLDLDAFDCYISSGTITPQTLGNTFL
ncbi:hypothetical protein BJX61DRAFT_544674 [Aspergillus egyptiacus]|nr:hypothetical protein BJX61DRAFT_544674 [Aspergillus egyptiacus]